MFKKLSSLISSSRPQAKEYKIQSFTYYIPGPPKRNSSYREKQFDQVFSDFLSSGHEIISLQTQTHQGPDQSGMWVICLVKPLTEKANLLINELKTSNENKVEGLYKIE